VLNRKGICGDNGKHVGIKRYIEGISEDHLIAPNPTTSVYIRPNHLIGLSR